MHCSSLTSRKVFEQCFCKDSIIVTYDASERDLLEEDFADPDIALP